MNTSSKTILSKFMHIYSNGFNQSRNQLVFTNTKRRNTMQKKILIALSCVLLIVPSMTSCGDVEDVSISQITSSSSQTESSASEAKFPGDIAERLKAGKEMKPITIPAEEWTADTLCQAVFIDGKHISFPCTLHELSEGFEVKQDEEYSVTINESNHRATASISYFGTYIGSAVVDECESEEDFLDSPIKMISFSFNEFDDPSTIPVACNGFSAEDSADKLKERLYFMDVAKEDEATGYYRYEKLLGDIRLEFCYSDAHLTSFYISCDI